MFKAVLIGDAAVGKTSIRRRYLGKGFISSHIATIGVDFAQKTVRIDDRPIQLVIWDLAGQEGYQRVRRHYYQGCSAMILVYDITNRESFENASAWLAESFKHVDEFPPVAILANKIDLRTSDNTANYVTAEEGEAFAKSLSEKLEIQTIFFETSAKNGENIQESFTQLGRILIENHELEQIRKKR
ncbi:GTP-binding protein [Candidatus Thorarchaeota archaeon]|nr:MAG: GTP-binding protein [Candidatus Thorarchaeota archaeon]